MVNKSLDFSQKIPFNIMLDQANFKKGQKNICGKHLRKVAKMAIFWEYL